jgi:preprotein translocase subunit YajC
MFPLLLLALLLVVMIMFSRRNKLRMAAADAQRRERITTGTDVMTTSGLYGTVVSVNPDGTALLSIAPGVEVRWSIAALREVSELPDQYREPITGTAGQPGQVADPAGGEGTDLPSSAPARPAGPSNRRPRRRGPGPA